MKTTRIGLLGGTFNPVHIGHMVIAQTALDKAGLDRVIFVPCHEPPHKKIPHLASARDRLAMIRLAVAENPRFDVSDVEVRRAGRSYTIDTVRHFRDLYKGKAKLHFIIGGDSFAALSAWHCIDEIARIVTFIVVNRPGYETKRSKIKAVSIVMPGLDISSSKLRQRVAEGKSIRYLVPDPVVRYIERKNIYAKK